MDTARMRRAFKYPTDDDETDASHEEMDEQEQETLLAELRASEKQRNTQYTMIFTALPLIVTLPFLWYLSLATTRTMALLCLLSITSLGSSAYIMYFIPIDGSASASISTSTATSASSPSVASRLGLGLGSGSRSGSRRSGGRGLPLTIAVDESPVHQYLPYLNAAIGVLLMLASWAYHMRADVPEGLWLFLLLPGVMFAMGFMARRSMLEVQSGLKELQGMRYEYKGA